MDLHHVAQLFQSLPFKVALTDRELAHTSAHLQSAFRDLESIYQTLIHDHTTT